MPNASAVVGADDNDKHRGSSGVASPSKWRAWQRVFSGGGVDFWPGIASVIVRLESELRTRSALSVTAP